MRRDLEDTRSRLDAVERLRVERQQQIAELREVLDRATAFLTANSADTGGKEAKAETDIAALQARVDALATAIKTENQKRVADEDRFENRLAALERSEARLVERIAPTLPDDKEQLWSQAAERLKSGQRDEGRRFYRAFAQRFPEDPRASQAQLAIGISLVEEKQFARAAAELQRLLDAHPRSPEVPEAMWQLSRAFLQLRFCTDARALLGDLVKRFPKSQSASSAEREMKTIKRLPKAACTS